MPELVTALGQGWTPGAYGIWFLVALVALYFLREWRETRKLSAEDRQARREGYAQQVESLQRENRELRNDLQSLHREHDDYRKLCRLETDQLRAQIIELQDELTGLKRQIAGEKVAIGRTIDRDAQL